MVEIDPPSTGGTVKVSIPFGSGLNDLGAGETRYASSDAFTTNEGYHQMPAPISGTAKRLYWVTNSSIPVGESLTVTLRINGADSSITITIAAGSSSGNDLVNTEAITAGDLICVKCVATNNGGWAGRRMHGYMVIEE